MEKRKYFSSLTTISALFSFVCLIWWQSIPILLLLCVATIIVGLVEKNKMAWLWIFVIAIWSYSYQLHYNYQDQCQDQEKIELIKE